MDIQPKPQARQGDKRREKVVRFKGKQVSVIITGRAQKEFSDLMRIVEDEIASGITNSHHQTLLKSIRQKIAFLRANPEYGTHIPRDRIPKEFINLYDVSNLWKINLSGAWRMIYTINGSAVEIISIILDIMNHRDYEKKFRYKRR